MESEGYYRLGAQFVLAVDTIYPLASFRALNNGNALIVKEECIELSVCIAIAWILTSSLAMIFTFACTKVKRRIDLILRTWFIASTIGVIFHLFSSYMGAQWTAMTVIGLLRLPYFYIVFVYWKELRRVCYSDPEIISVHQEKKLNG